MPQDRKEQLKKRIKNLTRRIGLAIKAHDHNEVSNLRAQRGKFVQSLIEEFDEYFLLKDRKSCFVTLEEAREHYENPENRKGVAVARAVSEMYQGREFLRERRKEFEKMSAEQLKAKVIGEIEEQMERMEEGMNRLLGEVGRPLIDFAEADKNKEDDFLDGIDLDSLL